MSAEIEPDEIGPWAVLVAELVEGAQTLITARGPMPRSACASALEWLDLCAFDEPLVPFTNSIEEPGLKTLLRVSFGGEAIHDLLLADRFNGLDPLDRHRRASAEVGGMFPEYPNGGLPC